MLTRLTIHDVVLIDRLALEFAPGLVVFTGETGAGKSILLDALGLALGARFDPGLVRPGGILANVTAEFAMPSGPAFGALLDEHGLEREDTLILRRMAGKDGKSRASINDQPVSIGLLRLIGGHLVEIHGQFESYGLLDAATHRSMLDRYGAHEALAGQVRAAYAAYQAAKQAEAEAADAIARARSEEEYLRAGLQELDRLDPQPGESDQLAARRTQMQHREKIMAALSQAQQLLGDHRGACTLVSEAATSVARIAPHAGAQGGVLLALLDRMAAELGEAENMIDAMLHDDALDPAQLNQAEERLFALRAAARKHQTTPDELPQIRARLAAQLAALDDRGDGLSQLARAAAAARMEFTSLCRTLSDARAQAAQRLTALVNKELPGLKLEQAALQIDLQALPEAEWGAQGGERVAFFGRTNPGAAAGPLQKIASGGELARFMLALKVALAEADPVPVLVFDEADAGIGGATAASVGERLALLAQNLQVLAVTHSPQVAARATQHWRVEKSGGKNASVTVITQLDPAARQEEIARMLAGNKVTDAARAAAAALIAGAAPEPAPAKTRRARSA